METRRCTLSIRTLSFDGRAGGFFNGEIYNYAWYGAELQNGGVRSVSQSDTEVLANT